MKALVIKPKSESELKLLSALFKKMGINSSSVSLEQLEDIGMSTLLRQVDRTKKVSRLEVMKKLSA
jgi:hypothetical protein